MYRKISSLAGPTPYPPPPPPPPPRRRGRGWAHSVKAHSVKAHSAKAVARSMGIGASLGRAGGRRLMGRGSGPVGPGRVRGGAGPRAGGRNAFVGSSVGDLEGYLELGGLDLSSWGHGGAKRVEDLLGEVRAGETTLTAGGPGEASIVRFVNVLSVRVRRADGSVLMEERQRFPDGRERSREGNYLSEKLLPGETWQAGVRRAVHEELGSANVSGQELRVRCRPLPSSHSPTPTPSPPCPSHPLPLLLPRAFLMRSDARL